MAKFIFVYKMMDTPDGSGGEYELFDGTFDQATKEATREDFNYGRRGVKIYELDADPAFDTTKE